jgi:hypothetical protein
MIIYTVIHYIIYWSSDTLDLTAQVVQLLYYLPNESHILHCHQNTIGTDTLTILPMAKFSDIQYKSAPFTIVDCYMANCMYIGAWIRQIKA